MLICSNEHKNYQKMKIEEPSTIHERLEILVDFFCKGNKTAFGRETDILPGVIASIIGGRKSKPSFELLQKIMTRYPEVKGDWLILGKGPMAGNTVAVKLSDQEPTTYLTSHAPTESYVPHENEVVGIPMSQWMQEYQDQKLKEAVAIKSIVDYLVKKDDSEEMRLLRDMLPSALGVDFSSSSMEE